MNRSGQAVAELVVGLIAVIVLFACLVQIGVLSKIHTGVMMEARRVVVFKWSEILRNKIDTKG